MQFCTKNLLKTDPTNDSFASFITTLVPNAEHYFQGIIFDFSTEKNCQKSQVNRQRDR